MACDCQAMACICRGVWMCMDAPSRNTAILSRLHTTQTSTIHLYLRSVSNYHVEESGGMANVQHTALFLLRT